MVDEFPQRVLIGEIYLPVEQLMAYYGSDLQGAHLPFNFQLLQCAWTAEAVNAGYLGLSWRPPAGRMAQLGSGKS